MSNMKVNSGSGYESEFRFW